MARYERVCETILRQLKKYARKRGVSIRDIQLRFDCPVQAEEHRGNSRFYAHAFHAPDTVCVNPEIAKLPKAHIAGILIHELGHVECDEDRDGAEVRADEWVRQELGINILYDITDRGLEFLDKDTMRRLGL